MSKVNRDGTPRPVRYQGKWQWSNWTIGVWWLSYRNSVTIGVDLLCFEGVWHVRRR